VGLLETNVYYSSSIPIDEYRHHQSASEINKLRMASQSCLSCQQAFSRSPTFFAPSNDNKEFGRGPKVLLPPINMMKRAASLGCPTCTVLISNVDASSLNSIDPEQEGTTLQRAVLDPDRAVAMYVGIDDISHTGFSQVPSSWSKYIHN
jgi:hypothetical protein